MVRFTPFLEPIRLIPVTKKSVVASV